jgi:RNA 3'-terminal phosphate cyclase
LFFDDDFSKPQQQKPLAITAPPTSTTTVNQKRVTLKTKAYKAQFEFEAENPDELPFKEGEELTVVSESEGWYYGYNAAGKRGMFPANYVSEIN